MKRLLIILSLVFFSVNFSFAQEDEQVNDKIREKMTEFIQRRMRLTRSEAERFQPVFMRYFNEWIRTLRENRKDRLILQQRIVELRLRYRDEFREIIGERRSIQVFDHQEVFLDEIRKLKEQRMRDRPPPRKGPFVQ